MPIDTKEKSISATFFPLVGPNPGWAEGTLDQADSQDACGLYRGLLIPLEDATFLIFAVSARVPSLTVAADVPSIEAVANVPSIEADAKLPLLSTSAKLPLTQVTAERDLS